MRMTFDFHANEQKQANFLADICVGIGQAMGAERVDRRGAPQRYSIVPYQSTHNTGGAAMGADPRPARSIATVRPGTCRMYSSPARALSPERRQEPDRPGRRTRLLDCGCDQALPERSGAAGAGIKAQLMSVRACADV